MIGLRMARYMSGRKIEHQSGSEEVETSKCDHCRTTRQSASATRYCPTCDECLCPSCSLMHTGAKLTKNHTLTDITTSSKGVQSTIPVPTWQECPEHKGETIRLFCPSHNALCCLICIYKQHKSCPNTTLIADLATDFNKSDKFKSFKTNMEKVEKDNFAQGKMLKLNEKKVESEDIKAFKEIDKIAEMAHLRIDKLKDNTIKTATEKKNGAENKLKQLNEIFRRLDSEIQYISTDVEKDDNAQHPERLFIAVKNSQIKLEQAKSDARKLKEGNYIKSLRIECTEEIDTLLNAKSVLGTFSEAHLTLKYVGEINVKSSSDLKDCNIVGIALMSPGQIIVADWSNKNIKVIDIKDNTVVQARECPVQPCNVALLNNNKIAVPLFDDKTIRLLSADDKLDMDHDIKFDNGCVGVIQEQQHGHLIVSYHEKVQIQDMAGTVIREFTTDTSGNPLFKIPRHLALSPDQSMLYVSDYKNNTVTCLTLDGDVEYIYRDAELNNPRGIAVDKDGHVLVCSGCTQTIHVLSPDCKKLKVIPIDQHRLGKPNVFAFCPTMNLLYISCVHSKFCDSIKMFHLE